MMKRNNRSLTKDEISALLGLLALPVACPKDYNSTTTNSFEIVVNLFNVKGNFFFLNSEVNGPLMFNAYQDLMPCCLGFPQYKGVTFST
jgi:hypothetical protein